MAARMIARPAMDSDTPCINGASCDPVSSHWPVRRGRRSMRERTNANTSGTFCTSSRITGVFTESRKPWGSARNRATREYRQLSRRSTAGARQLPVASPE